MKVSKIFGISSRFFEGLRILPKCQHLWIEFALNFHIRYIFAIENFHVFKVIWMNCC